MAIELKPKVRYAWRAMAFAVVSIPLNGVAVYETTVTIGWHTSLCVRLLWLVMSIMTWARGVILTGSWFKPNRKPGCFLMEAYRAFVLVPWFTAPAWGYLVIYPFFFLIKENNLKNCPCQTRLQY